MEKDARDLILFLLVTTAIMLILAGFIITIVLLYKRKQISFQGNLERLKIEYEKAILNTQLEIQEQTFQNISREIHDNIGISLGLAKLNLNTIELKDEEYSRQQVDASLEQLTKAIGDLKDISHSMNASYISGHGLINSLEQELGKIKRLRLFEIIFEVSGNTIFFDAQKELIIFRIAQEAFNNILKHADARKIKVHLLYDKQFLDLSIFDNGRGFSIYEGKKKSGQKKGAGLINMNKRAEMIRGHLSMSSSPSAGTLVKLTVPY